MELSASVVAACTAALTALHLLRRKYAGVGDEYAVQPICDENATVSALRAALTREKRERRAERAGRTKAERRLRELEASGGGGVSSSTSSAFAVPTAPQYIIGNVRTCFPDRRGVPRQPILCPATRGRIKFVNAVAPASFEGLDAFSHIWVVWLFHENTNLHKGGTRRTTFSPAKVAPPQNGGAKVGVFSCRTPHRPNAIGLSVVRLDAVDCAKRTLHVSGIDFVDGTPVLDVKPFLPLDVVPAAELTVPPQFSGADGAGGIPRRAVVFSPAAEAALVRLAPRTQFYPERDGAVLRAAVQQVLALDIRARRHGRGKATGAATFRCTFDTLVFEFTTSDATINVISVEPAALVKRRADAAAAAAAAAADAKAEAEA